jgi:hypothetical protein
MMDPSSNDQASCQVITGDIVGICLQTLSVDVYSFANLFVRLGYVVGRKMHFTELP